MPLLRELRAGVLQGSQGNDATLNRWVNESGGAFDVIIDDGSHMNSHMLKTFHVMWPQVNYGGLYVFEDIIYGGRTRPCVGRHEW